jgi:hypothetical protein
MKKLLHRIGQNASTAVALSSMLIAGLSLYFTVDAQQRDVEYKEVSIQPRPTLSPDYERLSLSLGNVGLGPAIVRQIHFDQDGKCVTSYGVGADEWQKTFTDFVKAAASEVYSKSLPPMPWSLGGRSKFDFEVNSLQENDTIPSNRDRWIFHLAPGSWDEFKKGDPSEQVPASDRFASLAYAIPMTVYLCSATGRTCMSVGNAPICASEHVTRN